MKSQSNSHTLKFLLITDEDEPIDLTPCEHKFLIALSSNNCITYEEIMKKVYDFYDDYYDVCCIENLRTIKFKFVRKTKIKIKTVKTIGFRLESKILFE